MNDELQIELTDFVVNAFIKDFYSPCELIKMMNTMFEINLPTQMMYNYIKKNYVTATLNSTNKKQISKDECVRFVTKYAEKNICK